MFPLTVAALPRQWEGLASGEISQPCSPDIFAAVRQLVLIANDDLIAGTLNRNGLATGNGNRWTRERVSSQRAPTGPFAVSPAAASTTS
jgi:hypothetical protein